jgi:hypothetical protein
MSVLNLNFTSGFRLDRSWSSVILHNCKVQNPVRFKSQIMAILCYVFNLRTHTHTQHTHILKVGTVYEGVHFYGNIFHVIGGRTLKRFFSGLLTLI